jgi:2-iminobutanoate/2-iminopropanoate deaminase
MPTIPTEHDISCVNSGDLAAPSGHYSHVCTARGMVYISGQLAIEQSGRPLSEEPFDVQVVRVLTNVDACLKAVGGSRTDLVQVRVYVTDIKNWPAFNRIYADWIGDHKPARAVAESPSLHYGLAVEVEAVAVHRFR